MTPAAWSLFLGSALIAECIGTMAGFGAATILTPIAALLLDVRTAIALVACFHLLGNASRLVLFGRHLRWRFLWQFGLIGILCSLLGARISSSLSPAILQACLGGFLLCYVGWELLAPGGVRLPTAAPVLVGGGALSGFIAGLLGTGGAIRSACLLAFQLPRDAYLGTSAAIALLVDATRLPVYVAARFLPGIGPAHVLGLAVTAAAGAWMGQRVVRRLPAAAFRRLVLALLALMAAKFLLDGVTGLVADVPRA